MGKTMEKQSAFKNGVYRLILTMLSMLFEVLVIFLLLAYAGSKAGWIYSLIHIISSLLVLVIYGNHKTSSIRMTWILMILLLPVFGTVLFFLIGLNSYTRKMRRRYKKIDEVLLPMLPDNTEVEEHERERDKRIYRLSCYLKTHSGYPAYENTRITYYDDAEKGFKAQKAELAKAGSFIFMEYHAIEDAACWNEIVEILKDRVRDGVEVRIFYDDMGSLGFINTDFVKRMEKHGMQCRVFNPFAPGLNLFLNNRDHRKITVIDGKVGFTGGYNMADEYFHRTEPFGYWKDTGVRLEGDAVRSLTVTFLEMWNAVNEGDVDDTDFTRYLPCFTWKELKEEREKARRPAVPDEGAKAGTAGADTGTAGAAEQEEHTGFVHPYADSPMDDILVGEDVYMSLAESAQDYVWYITPYLIITDEMIRVLSLAARRGVDVRIITPGIPDKKIVYSLTRSYYNSLTRNGVRIYEYTPGFCHAKMCVSDDLYATCGTINLDYRSLYHHFENGCLYADCDAVMQTKADFEATFKKCRDVTEQYTHGRGAFLRLGQMLLRLVAPLM